MKMEKKVKHNYGKEEVEEIKIKVKTWNIEAKTGYKPITTYYEDFGIADYYGTEAIADTYNMAIEEITDYKVLTEFVMVLNWKIWEHFENEGQNSPKARMYDYLWRKANEHTRNTLKDDELMYYYRTID